MIKITAVLVFFLSLLSTEVPGKDIRILAPYAGILINETAVSHHGYDLDIKDTSVIKGLFFQWVRTSAFQTNAFLYQSSNINYGTVWGGHLMGDLYFFNSKSGNGVVGLGSEFVSISMDADSHSMPMSTGGMTGFRDFEMSNTVTTPFARLGYRFISSVGPAKLTLFPWAGMQYQTVHGEIEVDFPAFAYPKHGPISGEEWYKLAGAGLNIELFHFLHLEGKYHSTFNDSEQYDCISAMANVFLTHHFGLSYRFKYLEMSSGSNLFHLGGLALIF